MTTRHGEQKISTVVLGIVFMAAALFLLALIFMWRDTTAQKILEILTGGI